MFLTSRSCHVLAIFFVVTSLLSGCSLYRPELNQGDYITQADLDRLEPGLTKNEVQQIMGSPALTPIFKLDQWNYTFAYVDGQHRDQPLKFKTISLYFKGDKLQSYSSRYWHPENLPKYKGR